MKLDGFQNKSYTRPVNAARKNFMTDIDIPCSRGRGRPPVRSDEETRHVIAEAAMREFLTHGYAGACMDDVARSAKVSKKTLYRLIPAKADLFRVSVTDRIAGFLRKAEATIDTLDVAAALEHYLTELGNLTLSVDTIAILRLAIAEADRFPELATNFYADAVLAGESVLTRFLKRQCALGVLEIDDPVTAAGMLRGMMVMEPQRATMLAGLPLPTPAEIAKRARECVRIFLRGCMVPAKP
jgi:AcrR family transcriptional regulator